MARRVSFNQLSARLAGFRSLLSANKLQAYVVPHNDAHQSEYIANCDERIAFLSGFDGSAGTCVVTADQALLWTDGRYFKQAHQQFGQEWTLMKDRLPETPRVADWLRDHVCRQGGVVGVDPMLMSVDEFKSIEGKVGPGQIRKVPENLVDSLWGADRPAVPTSIVNVQEQKYSGKTVQAKLLALRASMVEEAADVMVVSALDEVAWLLNMRGEDIAFNPLFFAHLMVEESSLTLFVDCSRLSPAAKAAFDGVGGVLRPYATVLGTLAASCKDRIVWVDPGGCNVAIRDALNDAQQLVDKTTPIALWKACKTEEELQGARNAHVRDGAAKTRWLFWMETEVFGGEVGTESKYDEVTVADRLAAFRAENELFRGLSFPSISSFGSNGATIHYHASKDVCAAADRSQLYLIDSGAQYTDGTTDVTRTVHFDVPNARQRDAFTRVLKGNIAISSQVFPQGTTGPAFDSLGRQFLWQAGLDFRHGIGHGVGSYLCVHEGPCGIGSPEIAPHRMASLKTPLQPGMILSNEPGYYEEGQWGIRIENLMAVVPSAVPHALVPGQMLLQFDTLTLIPIQKKMIDIELMTVAELAWLDAYHARVRSAIMPFMKTDEERAWLQQQTSPIVSTAEEHPSKKQKLNEPAPCLDET